MDTKTAILLLEGVTLKPGWRLELETADRFEDTINIKFIYPAYRSERELWPAYDSYVPGGANASFSIMVREMDPIALYRAMLEKIFTIEEHEWREFFRVEPTGWAPFHPHRVDGIKRWGNPEGDLKFGLV